MFVKINCVHNDSGAWCKNKKIKRSILGIMGARCCPLYYNDAPCCKHQEKFKKPSRLVRQPKFEKHDLP